MIYFHGEIAILGNRITRNCHATAQGLSLSFPEHLLLQPKTQTSCILTFCAMPTHEDIIVKRFNSQLSIISNI